MQQDSARGIPRVQYDSCETAGEKGGESWNNY